MTWRGDLDVGPRPLALQTFGRPPAPPRIEVSADPGARFLAREWQDKAEDYRRERDALQAQVDDAVRILTGASSPVACANALAALGAPMPAAWVEHLKANRVPWPTS